MSTIGPANPLWWRHERHGLAEWWLAGGELRDSHFELPDTAQGAAPNLFLLGARFERVDFSRLAFDSFTVADSVIDGCVFAETSFKRIDFGFLQYHRDRNRPIDWSKPLAVNAPRYNQTQYIGCQFIKIKLPNWDISFGNSRFDDCSFDDTLRSTVVRPIFTQPAEFVNCRFLRRVSCVVFDGRVTAHDLAARVGRTKSEFTGNDFSEAVLKTVDFRDIDLAVQRLPEDFTAPG